MPMQALEQWRAQARRRRGILEPHNLSDGSPSESGSYVANLTHIERRLAEAQQLFAKHDYEAARNILAPHLAQLPQALSGAVSLLLGQCAMHGARGNWPSLLSKAVAAYQSAGDPVGCAQARLLQGSGYFARGELGQAQTQLRAASEIFRTHRVVWGQAMVSGLQAQLHLAQHDLDQAMDAADTAVRLWASLNEGSEEATARLFRAQLWASAGRQQDAARDLLWAERLVEAGASGDEGLHVALSRADSLLWMGYSHRAAAALGRIAEPAQAHADICVRTHFGRAMGQALMVDAPAVGAQHLYTAIELLGQLDERYHLATAYINLACCEHRLGMPAKDRLHRARALGAAAWPVVRDALAAMERRLQAPSGRVTGPVPKKKFAVDAVDPLSQEAAVDSATRPQSDEQAPAVARAAARGKPWDPLLARLQAAWHRFNQGQRARRQALGWAPQPRPEGASAAAAEPAVANRVMRQRPDYQEPPAEPPQRQLRPMQAEVTRA